MLFLYELPPTEKGGKNGIIASSRGELIHFNKTPKLTL